MIVPYDFHPGIGRANNISRATGYKKSVFWFDMESREDGCVSFWVWFVETLLNQRISKLRVKRLTQFPQQ